MFMFMQSALLNVYMDWKISENLSIVKLIIKFKHRLCMFGGLLSYY